MKWGLLYSVILIVFLVALASCQQEPVVVPEPEPVEEEEPEEETVVVIDDFEDEPNETEVVEEEPVEEEIVVAPPVKEFEVLIQIFRYDPPEIEVNQGDLVKLTITAVDKTYGFSMPEYGIHRVLSRGETKEVEFIADQPGKFSYNCGFECGRSQKKFSGTLTVVRAE